MSDQPSLWTAPQPATDEELAARKLPFDIAVGSTVFRKGVPLLALVQQHRALWAQLYNKGELI